MSTRPAGRQLYIYWRCPAAQSEAAEAAARAMQTALCLRHPGLSAELFLRVDDRAATGLQPAAELTLMEVYVLRRPAVTSEEAVEASTAAIPLAGFATGRTPGITAEIQADVVKAGEALRPWLSGSRHVEVFELLT